MTGTAKVVIISSTAIDNTSSTRLKPSCELGGRTGMVALSFILGLLPSPTIQRSLRHWPFFKISPFYNENPIDRGYPIGATIALVPCGTFNANQRRSIRGGALISVFREISGVPALAFGRGLSNTLKTNHLDTLDTRRRLLSPRMRLACLNLLAETVRVWAFNHATFTSSSAEMSFRSSRLGSQD